MATYRKGRSIREDIPPSDDTGDDDYDVKSQHTSPKKRKPKTQGRSSGAGIKRARHTKDYASDDIEDDSDIDEEELSEEESDVDEVPTPINEKTGRPVRRSTQGEQKRSIYKDLDDTEIEASIEESEENTPKKPKIKRESKSNPPRLLVKLKLPPQDLSLNKRPRPQTSGKGVIKPTEHVATRRSSRISHDESVPLIGLTDSGRHAKIVRASASRSPPPLRRRSHGGKGLLKPSTSDIEEVSQENSVGGAEVLLRSDVLDESLEEPCLPIETGSTLGPNLTEDIQIASSVHAENDNENNDKDSEDDMPVTRPRRVTRSLQVVPVSVADRGSRRKRGQAGNESDEYDAATEEPEEEEGLSPSEGLASPQKRTQQSDVSSGDRRSGRLANKKTSASQRSRAVSGDSEEIDADEIAEEAAELKASRSRRRRASAIVYDAPNLRRRKQDRPDYRIIRPEQAAAFNEDDDAPEQVAAATRRRRGGGGVWRALHSTYGPFGGGGQAPVFVGPEGAGEASESSDDDSFPLAIKPFAATSVLGMTPVSALPMGHFAQAPNANIDPMIPQPYINGKSKDKEGFVDADPLADQQVTFTGVGGLDGHINQLKEMVLLPLLYPEVFRRFKVKPPRGVLFHGPPGTSKTLLARALSSSVRTGGQNITFYMKKGADTLSKYVGEAERSLRVLFEEARKNQPSIIFFDEIDGLAPVRSSKADQVHASVVATLLALMDGLDGRGQVIVIGATNRPDAVDSALRRPGRFDREFYFPLPDQTARRTIIDIHTTGWEPPLEPKVKDQLAAMTKGYGGADLKALCTEAALNAVQGTFPQIYTSNDKLQIDETQIKVLAKDFMISLDRMVPSSERSGSSGSSPLESRVEPLLRKSLENISKILDEILPPKKTTTALEEAQYDDRDEDAGFDKEMMRQAFERARVYRPRLLIHGRQGMGQQYLGAAILNKYERLFVQSVGLSILYGDSARTPEAAIVQLFNEAKHHKPSVLYIPNITTWYRTVGTSVIHLFMGLLRSLAPNDQVLVLGVMEWDLDARGPDEDVVRNLFENSSKSQFLLPSIEQKQREDYFDKLIELIQKAPTDYPDLENRKKRILPELQKAVTKASEGPSEEETKQQLKAQKKEDRHILNLLKISLQPLMDNIKKAYKKFRFPPIDDAQIAYLYAEADPGNLVSDLPEERRAQDQHRPYEIAKDKKGEPGLLEVATGKFYYNMEIVTIEQRLSNGYYKRTKEFLADFKKLDKDAKTTGDAERMVKATELKGNVEVDLQLKEVAEQPLMQACEEVYHREVKRIQQRLEQVKKAPTNTSTTIQIHSAIPANSYSTAQSTGPVVLAERLPGPQSLEVLKDTPSDRRIGSSSLSNGDHVPNSQSNGSFEAEEDAHMTNSQDTSGHQPNSNHTDTHGTPLNQQSSPQMTMTSSVMQLAPGSQLADYHNSASTTTSGQKTSNQSSGGKPNTQSTNGTDKTENHPNFAEFPGLGHALHIPDTQEPPSSGSQLHPSRTTSPEASQKRLMGPPSMRNGQSSINALLNNPESSSPPQLDVDPVRLHDLKIRLATSTQGLSVEQLEQINATLMHTIWQNRSDWNRKRVTQIVLETFEGMLADMSLSTMAQIRDLAAEAGF